MIGKLLAIMALVLVALYVASSLHLLSFSLPYGHSVQPYVPPMPANVSMQSIVHFITNAFST